MVRLRGRKACLAWGQIELHGGTRWHQSPGLSYAALFPQGACSSWAMGERVGLPTGRGQAAGDKGTNRFSAGQLNVGAYFTEELVFRCEY